MQDQIWDVIIIGAGAAGLMAAITAANRGKRVLVLEKNAEPGRKILISGGGRCNFTNLNIHPSKYLSSVPQFCISALRQYPAEQFIQLVGQHNIQYYEKSLGQLFCEKSSKQILQMLLRECQLSGNVKIITHASVSKVEKSGDVFNVSSSVSKFSAAKIIVASGGLSLPKLGVSGIGYDIAQHFGHELLTPRAGLVPLVWSEEDAYRYANLAGIALPVKVSFGDISFSEAMLFTHIGLSGPAILQISSYWQAGKPISINLLPEFNKLSLLEDFLLEQKKSGDKRQLKNLLSTKLPHRLAELIALQWVSDCNDKPVFQLADAKLRALAAKLFAWLMLPAGTEGFATAEVSLGGVSTQAVSSKTMESKLQPGLYFVGEVLDVSGWLGGYNFQWAWASGYVAGLNC